MAYPYIGELVPLAKELRKAMTKQERKLWYDFLSKHPVRFQRQKVIDRFIVDFYCPKAKLAIELDGSQHYSSAGKEYDSERTLILNNFQIDVLRFSNSEIDRQFDHVCETINSIVKERSK